MIADILKEDVVASSSIPRDSSHQTGDTRSTSFHALPAFDHSKFLWSTRENNHPLVRPGVPLPRSQKKKNEVMRIERISRSRSTERERRTESDRNDNEDEDEEEKEGPKKQIARTTEIPSSAFAQRLAPDTSTLPTTPQPPPHAS